MILLPHKQLTRTFSAAATLRIADSCLIRSTFSCSWSTTRSIFVLFKRFTMTFSRLATCTKVKCRWKSLNLYVRKSVPLLTWYPISCRKYLPNNNILFYRYEMKPVQQPYLPFSTTGSNGKSSFQAAGSGPTFRLSPGVYMIVKLSFLFPRFRNDEQS